MVLAVCLAALMLAACFEKIVDRCPDSSPYRVADQCYVTQPDGFVMVPCTKSSECSLAWEPICDTSTQQCRACQPTGGTSSECTAKDVSRPLCSSTGSCVECITNLDCLQAQKTCNIETGSCVRCTINTDCASGVCDAGGVCADPRDIVYVKRNGPSCPGQGTLDSPYCTVQTGLDQGALSGRRVVIFSGTYQENISIKPTTSAYTVNAIGLGQPTISPSSAGPAILLSNMGPAITVSLDGVIVQNAMGDSGINCTSTAASTDATRITVVRSTLRNNAKYGLVSQDCQVNLDQTRIELNQVGGLSLTDSDVSATNLLVRQNGVAPTGSTYGGINVATPNKGAAQIVDSTVVNNVANGGVSLASGVSCVSSTSILNTVVQGNTGTANEINAVACKPQNSAFVGAAAPMTGANNVELATCTANSIFQNPTAGDFTPISGGACTLVDKGAASATFGPTTVVAPDHDLNGRSRPQPANGMFDIGAIEL
jgi:hypothetical protein